MGNRTEIAALAGVAPFNHDRGTLRGARKITGGRARLRRVLFVATVVALRFNPLVKPFYVRLRAAGMPRKVGLVGRDAQTAVDPQRHAQTQSSLESRMSARKLKACPHGPPTTSGGSCGTRPA